MQNAFFRILLACLFFVSCSAVCRAQEAYTANASPKTEGPSPTLQNKRGVIVDRLRLADDALQFARANRSIPAWLVAAELFNQIPASAPQQEGDEKVSAAIDGFWQEAERAVQGDHWASGMLARARARQSKNLDAGPIMFSLAPAPGVSRVLRYRGGETAILYARPSDEPIRLTVYDQNGAVICRSPWQQFGLRCSWTPQWTGSFKVQVESRGTRPVQIATN